VKSPAGGFLSPLLGNNPTKNGDKIMKPIKIIKFVKINGCQIPVYASEKVETTISIDVKQIITGVILGTLATVASLMAFMA
jgi:hypothetical protein